MSMHLAPALPRVRRAGLALLLVLLPTLSGGARAQATSGISLRISGAPVEAGIAVGGDARRMVFGTLRSTAPLAKIELIDPAGRTVRSDTGAALKRMPAAEAVRPELGDVYFLPELRDAAPGAWRLRFVPAGAGTGRIVGAVSLRPRYELMLPMVESGWRAGAPTLIEVLASDNGEALANLGGIRVWIEDARGRRVFEGMAQANLRNARGILVSDDPRNYLIVATAPAPGRYRLVATHALGGRALRAERAIDVH
ncbi:MAG: hypothetical protein JF600_15930 [Xanthomonadales bacterium]|nr:hypothetical protein [Xanthomonadales bacterium]